MINETLAAQLFGSGDPIGRRLALGSDPDNPWLTVVGVVADVRHGSLERPAPPELYTSYLGGPPFAPYVVVRTAADPAAMATSVRQFARTIDPGVTVSDVRTMESVRLASVAERRFTLVLVAAFGAVALILAAMGVYGVITLVVAERTAELGLRLALGAVPAHVARLVVGDAVRVTAWGGAVGLAVAAAVAQRDGLAALRGGPARSRDLHRRATHPRARGAGGGIGAGAGGRCGSIRCARCELADERRTDMRRRLTVALIAVTRRDTGERADRDGAAHRDAARAGRPVRGRRGGARRSAIVDGHRAGDAWR